MYPNSNDCANGDGDGVVTSTTRTRPAATSRMSAASEAVSKSSCRHSRTASSRIGKSGCWAATASSCAERWRCCHSG